MNQVFYRKKEDGVIYKKSSNDPTQYAMYWHKNIWNTSASVTNTVLQTKAYEQFTATEAQIWESLNNVTTAEEKSQPKLINSGAACEYYRVPIQIPQTDSQPPYVAECVDIMRALGMNYDESNIFKEIWRTCAERTLGLKKEGNSVERAAEKILFFAKGNYNQVLKPTLKQDSAK